jgi:hypothetical protein
MIGITRMKPEVEASPRLHRILDIRNILAKSMAIRVWQPGAATGWGQSGRCPVHLKRVADARERKNRRKLILRSLPRHCSTVRLLFGSPRGVSFHPEPSSGADFQFIRRFPQRA